VTFRIYGNELTHFVLADTAKQAFKTAKAMLLV